MVGSICGTPLIAKSNANWRAGFSIAKDIIILRAVETGIESRGSSEVLFGGAEHQCEWLKVRSLCKSEV